MVRPLIFIRQHNWISFFIFPNNGTFSISARLHQWWTSLMFSFPRTELINRTETHNIWHDSFTLISDGKDRQWIQSILCVCWFLSTQLCPLSSSSWRILYPISCIWYSIWWYLWSNLQIQYWLFCWTFPAHHNRQHHYLLLYLRGGGWTKTC